MTHPFKYPQPTPEELAEPKNIWLSVNRFWWEILQGQLEGLPNPDLWEDYTPEIDLAIHEMMIADIPGGSTPMSAKAYRSTNYNVPASAVTEIPLDFDVYSDGILLSGGVFQITEAGRYAVKGAVGFTSAGGLRAAYVYRNETLEAVSTHEENTLLIASYNAFVQVVWEGDLAIGDEISLRAFQNSSDIMQVLAGSPLTWMSIHKIG